MARIHVPLDVNYADDPKVIEAGERAEILFLRALAFCKKLLTDGHVTDSQLQRFGLRGVTKRAEKLVEVGLWERVEGGFRIVSWLKHNKSADEIRALSDVRAEAGKQGGRPPQKQIAKEPESKPETHIQDREKRETDTEKSPTAQSVLAAVLNGGREYPERFRGHLGREIKTLLTEGISPDRVQQAAAACIAKGLSPSTLPSLVVQVQSSGAAPFRNYSDSDYEEGIG